MIYVVFLWCCREICVLIKLHGCFRLSGITMAVDKKEYNNKKFGTTDFLCFIEEDHRHSATGVWGWWQQWQWWW